MKVTDNSSSLSALIFNIKFAGNDMPNIQQRVPPKWHYVGLKLYFTHITVSLKLTSSCHFYHNDLQKCHENISMLITFCLLSFSGVLPATK